MCVWIVCCCTAWHDCVHEQRGHTRAYMHAHTHTGVHAPGARTDCPHKRVHTHALPTAHGGPRTGTHTHAHTYICACARTCALASRCLHGHHPSPTPRPPGRYGHVVDHTTEGVSIARGGVVVRHADWNMAKKHAGAVRIEDPQCLGRDLSAGSYASHFVLFLFRAALAEVRAPHHSLLLLMIAALLAEVRPAAFAVPIAGRAGAVVPPFMLRLLPMLRPRRCRDTHISITFVGKDMHARARALRLCLLTPLLH